MKVDVFWIVDMLWKFTGISEVLAASNMRGDGGGSKNLLKIGALLPNYTVQQPRRQPSL
jgi:hypothetical protein